MSGLRATSNRRRETILGFLMMSPVAIPIATFVLLPVALIFVMSLQDWNLIGGSPRYAALRNYTELARDEKWWQSLVHTLYFAALTVPIITVLGLLLAWSIFRHVHTRLVEAVIFAPYVLPPVATVLTWAWIFNPSYGALNEVLAQLGLPTVDWLGNPHVIIPAMAIYAVWQGTGFSMVLYLGSLGRISREVFEAAALDGAGTAKIARKMVVPLVGPTTYVVMIISTVGALKVFVVSYIFTTGTGGPELSGLTVVLYQYQQAFVNFRAGYGAAISIALSVILLIILGVGMALGRRKVFYR